MAACLLDRKVLPCQCDLIFVTGYSSSFPVAFQRRARAINNNKGFMAKLESAFTFSTANFFIFFTGEGRK